MSHKRNECLKKEDKKEATNEQVARLNYTNESVIVTRGSINLVRLLKF